MKFQDYYEVLGVARGATADEIRRAYRKLAMKWHPDRHQGDSRADAEERFKRISEAYEVLSDPEKRKKYDAFGENWKHGQEFTPPPGGGGGARRMTPQEFEELFGQGGGFSDFFTNLFGEDVRRDFASRGGRHPRFRHRGADVRAELAVPVGEALRGGRRRLQLPVLVTCARCGGVGQVGQHVCPTCVGVGTVRQQRSVEVNLPPRVRDGTTLRLRGLGEPGETGGESGDLHLRIRLEPDGVHRLAGDDIEIDLPVLPWDAVFGAKLDLETPDGPVTLTVPPDTAAGARLRLRGRGLDDGQGGRGDLLAVVRLTLPRTLTERQRQLLAELRAAGQGAASGHKGGTP